MLASTVLSVVPYAAIVNPVFADCVQMNIFGGVQNISPEAAASGLKWYYDRQDKNAPLVEWNQS